MPLKVKPVRSDRRCRPTMTGLGMNSIAIASEKRLSFFVSETSPMEFHSCSSSFCRWRRQERNDAQLRQRQIVSSDVDFAATGECRSRRIFLTTKCSQTNENVSRKYQQTTFNSYTVCWRTVEDFWPSRIQTVFRNGYGLKDWYGFSVNSASSLRVLEWHWENTLIVCCWIKASFWLD